MCVVAPGKQPVTESEKVLSTSSGHIIHLMPGDNHYDPSSFCVVLAWNGLNHYTLTYLMKHSSILQHRCSVITRLLSKATEMFSDIESDLDESKDEDLIDHFHNLRDQTVQANHLLVLKGLEHPKLPSSVGGPHPNDVKGHLTRKTPLPAHPEPLISHALQHPLDPGSAFQREHPTPYLQPPPASKDIKQEDFDINPDDYRSDQPRCIKVPGQLAPGRSLPSKKEIIVSIPYPLDPVKGHPPAKKDSIGAKRFREGWVLPPTEAELVETVQQLPSHRIMQKPDETSSERILQEVIDVDQQSTAPHSCVCPPEESRIMQKIDLVIDVDAEDEEVSSQQPFTISSETVEEITIEDDDDEEDVKNKERQKLQNLKRKLLPSRKSPRIKILKLDLKKGVKTALPSQHQDIVESLAKEAMKKFKGQKPEVPLSKQKQGQPSSSSSSSHVSGKQRSVLEMYTQAARRIAHPAQASGSQRHPPHPAPAAGRIMQKPKKPQSAAAAAAAPPPVPQSHQSHPPASQPVGPPAPCQRTQKPAPPHWITQADPEKGPVLSCTYCNYTTLRKESLTDHLRMHTGDKIKCSQCDKSYFSEKSLKNHFKFVHLKKDRCFCTEAGCTWSGKDYGNRKVHLYESHSIGEPPACDHPDCKDRGHFSNFRTLERHRKTYHKPKDLQCPHCDKKYKEAENLENHVAVQHKGKSAFQCEICGQFYNSQKSLKGHKKEHE